MKKHKLFQKKRIRNMVPKPTQKYGTHDLSVIVRVFLSKKLVTETFVALKATGGKDALKETHFYKCLLSKSKISLHV